MKPPYDITPKILKPTSILSQKKGVINATLHTQYGSLILFIACVVIWLFPQSWSIHLLSEFR